MLPGTFDDLIAQRIEHYRDRVALEQNPVTRQKFGKAIEILAKAPRQVDELQDLLLDKKVEFGNKMVASTTGMVPPSWAHDLLVEIRIRVAAGPNGRKYLTLLKPQPESVLSYMLPMLWQC